MDPLSLLVSTGGIAALILQGVSSQVKRKEPNALGAIDLTLAAIAAVVVSLLRSGNVVIATDFGLIMAQGTWTIPLVRAALVAAAILPALCWNRARALNEWPSSRLVAIAAGTAMGLWAATQVRILNPVDPLPLQFHVYDVWWPPLVIWFTLCVAGCMLALVGLRGARYCIAMTAALVVPASMFVLAWPTLLDRAAVMNPWWISLEWVSLLIAWLAAARWRITEDGGGRWSRILLTIGGAAAATIVFRFVPMPGSARAILGAAPLAIITARLLRAIVLCKRDADAKRGPNRLHAVCLSLSLPIIAAGLIDLTSIGWLPRSLDIMLIVGFWILLAERLGDQMLMVNLGNFWRFAAVCVLRDAAVRIGTRTSAAAASTKDFFAVKPGQSGWVVGVKGAFAFLVVLFFWVVLSEAWSARPIVIRPFQFVGAEDDKETKAAAAALTSAVINALGRLRNDLSDDQAAAVRKSIGAPPAALALFVRADSNALENAVAQSSDLEISGLKVSVKFFVPFIEEVVRTLMGVRVIEGSVRKSQSGVVVMMSSSKGGSWSVAQPAAGGPPPRAGMCDLAPSDDAGADIVEELAFDIVSDDPGYAASGLTRDFIAFRFYRRGLKMWDEYESGLKSDIGSNGELRTAIDCFREAARRDRKFAQAYHHLGLALRRDGQPRAAIEALRSSVTDGEVFVPAVLQEASTQYNFTTYTSNEAAILPPVASIDAVHAVRFGSSAESALQQQRDEALRLWTTVTSLPSHAVSRAEARAAYFGICQYGTDNLWWLQTPTEFFVPYFYCSRARALWSWATSETAEAERAVEAGVLTYLGLAMVHHNGELKKIPASVYPDGWTCAESSLNLGHIDSEGRPTFYVTHVSARLGRAVNYFRQSLSLVPTDDFTRCLLAASRVALDGNTDDMRTLSARPLAHFAIGYDVLNNAHREAHDDAGDTVARANSRANATWYYNRALHEFETAIRQDPGLVEVLDMYGYVVWQWTLDALDHRTSRSPDPALLAKAERYAREAERLSLAWRKGSMEKSARSTVGELLIAQGRAGEAVEKLAALLADSDHWEGEDELRWDLAQAKLCQARQDAPKAQSLREEARQLFADILAGEQSRDRRGFTEVEPEAINPALRESVCPSTAHNEYD